MSGVDFKHRQELIEKRNSGERVVVWATGISGSGRLEYVKLQQQLAQANGKDFEILDVKNELEKVFRSRNQSVDWDNILDLREVELHDKVQTAYERIARKIVSNPEKDYVVSGHACFFWDNCVRLGFHPAFFEEIKPDLFVSVIKPELDIVRELNEGNNSSQWKKQGMTPDLATTWMCNEVAMTKMEADREGKPWAVISRYMSPTSLYMGMYHPEKPWMYFVQQMTHALKDGSYSASDLLFMELYERGLVFNPKGYELYHFDKENPTLSKFTVERDVNWYVRQADVIPAFYHFPKDRNDEAERLAGIVSEKIGEDENLNELEEMAKKKGPTPSEGCADECYEAYRSGKPVYRIWPPNPDTGDQYCSPFLLGNTTEVFKTPEDFLKRFDEVYGGPVEMNVPEEIRMDAFKESLDRRVKDIPDNFAE